MKVSQQLATRAVLVLLPLATLGITGCDGAMGSVGSSEPSQVASKSRDSVVEVPASWKPRHDLHDAADIQVADLRNECYMIAMSESKLDFDEIDLQDYSDITREGFLMSLDKVASVNGPKDIQVGGCEAIEYELRGTIDGIKVVYLHTVIEGEQSLHQLLAWTLPSKWKRNEPILRDVVASFREE